MAKNIISIVIAGELKGVKEAAAEARRSLNEVESKGQSSSKKLGQYATAAAAGIAGVALAAAGYAIKAGSELQESQDNLENALDRTHQTMRSFGGGLDALLKQNEKWGHTNAEVYESLQSLVRAGVPAKRALADEATAANLAAARHISLSAATGILTKVETGHVSLLGRLGIQTKDATGKTISQAAALQLLADKYGGAATAAGGTFQGKIAAAKAQLSDTAAKIGVKLIPVLLALAQFILTKVIPAIGAIVGWVNTKLIPALVGFSLWVAAAYQKYVKPSIEGIVQYFKGLWLVVSGVFNLLNDLFHGRWSKLFGDLKQIAKGAVDQVVGFFRALPIKLLGLMRPLAGLLLAPFKAVFNGVIDIWDKTVGKILHGQKIGVGPFHVTLPNLVIPKLHTGGVYRAPMGTSEGLAFLQDGETVLPRGYAGGAGGNLIVNAWQAPTPAWLNAQARRHNRRNGITGAAA